MAEGAALDCGFPINAAPGGGADHAAKGSKSTRTHALPFRWDQRHGNIGLVEMGRLGEGVRGRERHHSNAHGRERFSLFGLGT